MIAADGSNDISCAVTDSGDGFCWGTGSLQNSAGPDYLLYLNMKPTKLPGTTGAISNIAVAGGTYGHICATQNSGGVVCWGTAGPIFNNPAQPDAKVAAPVAGLTEKFTQLAIAGTDNACGLTAAGAVICWGAPKNKGDGTAAKATPVRVLGFGP